MMVFNKGFSRNSKPTNINFTPDGVLDNVLDSRGNNYTLSDLLIKPSALNSSNAPVCSSASYFRLYFEEGCGMEDSSNPLHNQRRAVVCKVFEDLSNFINSPLTTTGNKVNIWVRNINNGLSSGQSINGVLGFGSGFYVLPRNLNVGGIADNEIWKTIHTGRDSFQNITLALNGLQPVGQSGLFYHGMIAFNFNDTALPPIPNTNPINWNTNLTATTIPSNQFDLYSAVLHEVTHALGFNSLLNADGNSKFGNNFKYFNRYDTFLKTNNSNDFLLTSTISSKMFDNTFNSFVNNKVLRPNPLTLICDKNNTQCNDAIKFVGNNFTVPVFTPNCFVDISSLSHFEDQHYPICNTANGNDNYFLMCNSGSSGIIRRFLKPEERATLCDIGYSVKTIFGSTSTFNGFFNYGGSVCNGIIVSGVNDGINSSNVYTIHGLVNSNISISGNIILGNDVNATGFENLQDLSANDTYPSFFSTNSGNSASNIMFNSAIVGLHLLRYIPINGTQKGNITYIYVFVTPIVNNPTCNNITTACNLVLNGDFEQNNNYLTLPQNNEFSRLCNWSKTGWNSPKYIYANTANLEYNVPCNRFGNQIDKITSNKGYASLKVVDYAPSNYKYSEILKTTLPTSLLPNTNYQISFDVSLAESLAYKYSQIQAFISSTNFNETYVGINIPSNVLNTGILLPNLNSSPNANTPIFVNNSSGWQTISYTFTTGANTTNFRFLYLGGLNNFQTTVGQNPQPSVCGLPYSMIPTGVASDFYIDNVSLIALTGNFNLPTSINCSNTPISNLQTLISGFPSNGVFTGLGVTVSNTGIYSFSPSLSGQGLIPITYSYTSGGCAQAIVRYINVTTPSVIPTFATIPTICKNAAFSLPLVSTNGIAGTWSPAFDNQNTITYTFIPIANSCGIATTRTVTISTTLATIPTFTSIPAICYGATLILPTTSNNGIVGTWFPAINNTETTTYTFIPNNGLCTNTKLLTVVVNPPAITITGNANVCIGAASIYNASVSGGIWSLSNPNVGSIDVNSGKIISTNAGTTNVIYTLTTGTCTLTSTLIVTVFNPNITAVFSFPTIICPGSVPPVLPNISDNGIPGNWTPAIIDNTISATYTFKPTNLCSPNSTVFVSLANNTTLVANDDTFNIPFSSSSQISPNILLNDTFNGVLLTSNSLGLTTFFQSTPTYGITANANGTLNIPANLAIGTYIIKFLTRKNCLLSNTAVLTINIFAVPANNIINAPTKNSIDNLCYKPYAYTTIQSIFDNVTIGGVPASAGSVSISNVVAPAGFSLNANGTVNIPAGALPEIPYNFTMTFCPVGSSVGCIVNVPLYFVIDTTLSTKADHYSYGTQTGWFWSATDTTFRNIITNDQYSSTCGLFTSNIGGQAILGTNVTLQSAGFVTPTPFFAIDTQGLINRTGSVDPTGGAYYFNYRICDKNYPTICQNGKGSVLVYSNARPAKEIISKLTETNESVFDLEQFTLFPNPSNGVFNLAFQEVVKTELNVNVINLLGQLLYESTIVNKKDFELDLSNLTSGTYLLKISQEQKIITKKLIIK